MVEGCNQLDLLRQEHTVTEHVARHIANTCNRERLGLDILVELTEVPLHSFPCTARSDCHTFVIVTGRTTRCESIIEPEIMCLADRICRIGEGCRALIGSNNEIRIVIVVTNHFRRRHNIIVMNIVSDRQKCGNEDLIGITTGFKHSIAIAANRQTLRIEAALGTNRDNHRILDLLCFYETQDFCAIILCAIRPAQTATRYSAKA